MDAKMKQFVESPVSNEFGLSVDVVAEKCKTYGRFEAWLNGDLVKIKEVLNQVKNNGVSPAFFASYERTEGYNSKWGWLNHTSVNGNYLTDSDSVSQWIVEQSKNTTDNPAWIDYANYNDFVPADVKAEGNVHFAGLKSGSIGKVVIAGTAAATWEVYYPNGLKAEYNGVQDYGAPITAMLNSIEEWGGSLDGGGEPTDPTDPTIDFEAVINEVVGIVNGGRQELKDGFNVDTTGVAEMILERLKGLYKAPLYLNTKELYTNTLFRVKKTYENILKINPNAGMDEIVENIVNEALEHVTITLDIDDVFDSMVSQIQAIEVPSGGGGTDPEPTEERYFPVNVNDTGVNFWSPPHNSSIEEDMDFGYRTNGDFHAGYDVGAGGNANIKVYAVTGGTVTFAGDDGTGWGTRVVIKHSSDSYHSLYAHLKTGSLTVSTGDSVTAGQQIGIMGGSGGNYAIHLHYELSETGTFDDGNTIDPKSYLKVTGDNQTGLPNPV